MIREMSGHGNAQLGKCPSGEMSCRGSLHSGRVQSGDCSFGEMSVGALPPTRKCQLGICARGSVSRGTVQSGNCPETVTEAYFMTFDTQMQRLNYSRKVQIFS